MKNWFSTFCKNLYSSPKTMFVSYMVIHLCWVVAVLQSCASSESLKTVAIGERNVNNLARLNLGMGQTQVLGIMRDPYKEEHFQVGEDQYDVWFYLTQFTAMGQTRMVPMNMTPITFKNDKLIGMGYNYYEWLQAQSKAPKKPVTPIKVEQAPKTQTEDSLEAIIQENAKPPAGQPKTKNPPKPAASPNNQNATSFHETEIDTLTMNMSSKQPKEKPPEPPKDPQPAPKKDIEINEKDNEMIEDEQDQNFDFW